MAGLSVRKLDAETLERLQLRAAEHGVSMEEEALRIPAAAVAAPNPCPAEGFLDALADQLADTIRTMPCGASINCRTAAPVQVLRDMRNDPEFAQIGHEPKRVIGLVRTDTAPGLSAAAIANAASRSAVPVAAVSSTSTSKP